MAPVGTVLTILTIGLLLLAGCGDDDDTNGSGSVMTTDAAPVEKKEREAAKPGTAITVADSEFGEMLFDSNKQAIYIFENDPKGDSVCYDECAAAWPPVLTKGEPEAGDGVDGSLLGTITRREGSKQVTYAGQPLYFYAHEGPGEVECHNVNLNGGFWWVVGPDGNRLS